MHRPTAAGDGWLALYDSGLAQLGAGSRMAGALKLAEATGLAMLTGQAGREAAAAAATGMAYRLAGDLLSALGHALQALVLAQALGQEHNAALISYDLAILLVSLGRAAEARPYARQAAQHAELAEQARGLLARIREL